MNLLKKPTNAVFMMLFFSMVAFLVLYFFRHEMPGLLNNQGDYRSQESASLPNSVLAQASHNAGLTEISKPALEDNKLEGIYLVRRNHVAMREIKEWFAARGNYNFEDPAGQDDYKNYDLEVLKKLGEVGDVRAIHQLIEKADDLNAKANLSHRAAIYGSTAAIERLGFLIEDKAQLKFKTLDEQKPHLIEILSYFEAAKLRGDESVNIFSGNDLLRKYPTDLSREDLSNIKSRAKDIYNDLQKSRMEVGLGEFDNSVPQSVGEYFKELNSEGCNKNYTKFSYILLCDSD